MVAIEVLALADHEWAVQVPQGDSADVTYHKVRVELDSKTLDVSDEAVLVRKAIENYLAHAPAAALPHDLTLDWLQRNVPSVIDELNAHPA